MLRELVYVHSDLLIDTLKRFKVDVTNDRGHIALLRFEVISPDSFIWRIIIEGKIYYLYAEDYIPGIAHVRGVFSSYLESNDYEIIEVRQPVNFDTSAPVRGATTYAKPNDADTVMQFAVDSGHDFVFLALSAEDASDGLFSDKAPRGYSY